VVLRGEIVEQRRGAGAARQGRRIVAMLVAWRDLRTPHGGDRRPALPVDLPGESH